MRSLSLLRLTALLLFAGAALAQSVNEPPADWPTVVSLHLLAPEMNRFGTHWDQGACGGVIIDGFMTGAFPCMPDMWLIIIDSRGRAVAYLKRPGDRTDQSRNPLRVFISPASVMSMARCPDHAECAYTDINVPEGAYGVVVLDQDNIEFDFMGALILYTPGRVTDTTLNNIDGHVLAYLDALRTKGRLSGAPSGRLPRRPVTRCKESVCNADELPGAVGVRIFEPQPADFEGILCSIAPVTGNLIPEISVPRASFELHVEARQCSGKLDYVWNFGDGETSVSDEPKTVHVFPGPGTYSVQVTPRCASAGSGCDGTPIQIDVEVR